MHSVQCTLASSRSDLGLVSALMYVGFQRRRSVELATRLSPISTVQAPSALPLLQPPHSSRNAKCLCMTKPIIIVNLALLCNASRPHERLLTGYDGPVLTYHFPCTNGGEAVCIGYITYRQFNIHKSYVLPTQLYLCVLCGSQNSHYFPIQH